MTGWKRPTAIAKAFACAYSILTLCLDVARAADLATSPTPAPAAALPDLPPRWFVRLGALGVINQSSSKLYAQPIAGVVAPGIGFIPISGVGPQVLQAGRGATYSNFLTASLQLGYFVTANWSLEISGGFPVWDTVKITGFSATAPTPGTVLSRVLPAGLPVTVVYHFTQFGAFQPYLGAGLEPIIALAVHDGFNTGGSFDPSLGAVLQGGFDYMFSRNWGVFLDVKKVFTQLHGKATGIDLGAPIGTIPAAASIRTNAQPWVLAAGLAYRF